MLNFRLGRWHFWPLFIGFHTTFLVQHWLGASGMPRRYADYSAVDGFTTLNVISSVGAFILGISTLPYLFNVWYTARYAPKVEVDDPWGFGNALEWAHVVPAAAAQLPPHPADQVGTPGVRPQVPPRHPGHAQDPQWMRSASWPRWSATCAPRTAEFAARIDRMNATGANVARGRFSREVSARRLVLLLLATLLTAVLMGVVTFLAHSPPAGWG